MRFTPAVVLTALGAVTACGASLAHRTSLSHEERTAVVHGQKSGSVFRRIWRRPGVKRWGLSRWDSDGSSAVDGSPSDLLQVIRDELGRLNQNPPVGDDVLLTATVYLYKGEGFFREASVSYELVARDRNGKAVWVVDDEIHPIAEMAQSLADTEATIIAREILRKVRKEFGL